MPVYYHGFIRLQLSAYRGAGGVQALMKGNARKLAEQDESMLRTSGIPYTIIRTGSLQSTPGGQQGFSFEEVLLLLSLLNVQERINIPMVLSFRVLNMTDSGGKLACCMQDGGLHVFQFHANFTLYHAVSCFWVASYLLFVLK